MQENVAKTTTEWVFVARSLAQLPDGQSQAMRCMARAQLAAEDVADWIAVAEAWAQNFGDDEMAWQCLDRAETLAENSDDWNRIAYAWEELGHSMRAEIARRRLYGPTRTFGRSSDEAGTISPPVYDDYTHVENLGTLTVAITRHGAWDTYSRSRNMLGSYARFYSFTVPLETEVTIDLTSVVDTYLFLLIGDSFSGTVVDQNDDGPNGTDSRIIRRLSAGTYTVEATTFSSGETGNFVLKITPSYSYPSRRITRDFRSFDIDDDDNTEYFFDDDDSSYSSPYRA